MPRYEMTRPCKHCPFRNDSSAIRFQCRERAEDIAFTAYLFGFPCHTSADYVEDDADDAAESGYVFGQSTQHCVGYIIMQIQESQGTPWPGINMEQELLDRLTSRVDLDAPVFPNLASFLKANDNTAQHQ